MVHSGQKLLKIGELAQQAGVTVRTIRYYEELGLLSPAQTSPGGFRLYTDADLRRLNFIKRFKNLDFPLEEILRLLSSSEGSQNKAEKISTSLSILEKQLEQVENKIKEMDAIKQDIKEAIKLLHECDSCRRDGCLSGCPNMKVLI